MKVEITQTIILDGFIKDTATSIIEYERFNKDRKKYDLPTHTSLLKDEVAFEDYVINRLYDYFNPIVYEALVVDYFEKIVKEVRKEVDTLVDLI